MLLVQGTWDLGVVLQSWLANPAGGVGNDQSASDQRGEEVMCMQLHLESGKKISGLSSQFR